MNNMKKNRILFLLGFVFVIMCTQQKRDASPVIARANNSQFTVNDLREVIPSHTGFNISKVQIQDYIQRWIEREMVYEKALSMGLDDNPQVQKKLYNLKKDYLVAVYLEQNIDNQITISEDEIESFYNENAEELVRPEDLYYVNYVLASDYRTANSIRLKIRDGDYLDVIAQDSTFKANNNVYRDLGWVTLDGLSETLASKVKWLSVDKPSNPFKTDAGYGVVLVTGIRKKGETQSLEEVRDQLVQRLRVSKREKRYAQLINELKENSDVKVNWTILDSLHILGNESDHVEN